MMEEVSSEDTNGDSTFEFVGDTNSMSASEEKEKEASSIVAPPQVMGSSEPSTLPEVVPPQMPSVPQLPAAPIPISLAPVLPSNTQTITSIPGGPICYAPIPSYDALSVPTATIDLSGLPETFAMSASISTPPDSPSTGLWGWFKQSEILNKFAEKAKNSVDTMITTLDPGMKDYIYSGGDANVVVANASEWVVSAVREAFLQVFGRCTIQSCQEPVSSGAPQPVGFSAGVKNAEEKCHLLRTSGAAAEDQAILALQSILLEATPEKWFEVSCLVLQVPHKQVFLQVYTQATPVPDYQVIRAQDATPPDYPLRWSGLAVTLDQAAGSDQWSEELTGVKRRETVLLAARTLAALYKAHL